MVIYFQRTYISKWDDLCCLGVTSTMVVFHCVVGVLGLISWHFHLER